MFASVDATPKRVGDRPRQAEHSAIYWRAIATDASAATVSPYTLQIICLANSKKEGGRCVAGKLFQNSNFRGWIRPVSTFPNGELSLKHREYSNGTDPELLDIIAIRMSGKGAHAYQVENHTIDETFHWGKVGRATYSQLLTATDPVQPDLWGTSFNSSYSGTNDRVPVAAVQSFSYSLRLIKVEDLRIHVSAEGAAFNDMRRKVRGFFTYSNSSYAWSITDPVVHAKYLLGQDGWYDVGRAVLCVSLGEPYGDNNAYKLIAGVILPP